MSLPFDPVRVVGSIAYISGHGPQAPNGQMMPGTGKVGAGVTLDEAYHAAQLTGLSILADLQRALGSLDRIASWGRVLGMVNSAPGFTQLPDVINGFSNLVLDVFGPEIGSHARTAIGVAELPFGGIPVEIEGEVHLHTTE